MDAVRTEVAPLPLDDDEARLRRKALKRHFDATRPLESWERYRALNDAMDEAYEVIDISNREARFALILMGGLNAVVLIAATRAEFSASLSPPLRVWAAVLLVIYAVFAVTFLLQAIEALRPGHFRPRLGDWRQDDDDYPMGVRYYEDVVTRDAGSYWKAWREVRVGQLNAELAVQVHSLCLKSNVKRVALRRLYASLRVQTLLIAALVVMFVYSVWL